MARAGTVTNPKKEAVPPADAQRDAFELTDILDRDGGQRVRINKAYRRKPMIQTLLRQGILSAREYQALHVYRHYASLADKSPIRDSLMIERAGGTGNGPTNELLHAAMMTGQCEAAAGSLADILRAVVVDDVSLSEWAVRKHGGCEKRREGRATTIEPTAHALGVARIEIKFAAGRVEARLAA